MATTIASTRPRIEANRGQALPKPYLLFLGDTTDPGFAKTAFGLRDWASDDVVGEFALPGATVSTGLDFLTPHEAAKMGARALLIGVANAGGAIPPAWIPTLFDALETGLDIVSGMHTRLADLLGLSDMAKRTGRRLVDVRVPPPDLPVGTGVKRSGKRILTVGTDCALGKKYTALAVTRELRKRGIDADFRATGQTGIMISGSGIPIDAVVSDFVAGAAEMLSPSAAPDHFDVIEGQGSLFHPAYASVSLGLLHGSQPDRFIVCHQPGRTHILGNTQYSVPTIEDVIARTVMMGQLTNPAIRCAGVALNTSGLDAVDAEREIDATSAQLGLPVSDPMRGGIAFERLLDACVA